MNKCIYCGDDSWDSPCASCNNVKIESANQDGWHDDDEVTTTFGSIKLGMSQSRADERAFIIHSIRKTHLSFLSDELKDEVVKFIKELS
jgi:hypothetical protein